jgi:thioesterase domain-containing protein
MPDRPDVGLGPRLLAIETAIRVLIEHASSTDPALRDRIKEAADAYVATIRKRKPKAAYRGLAVSVINRSLMRAP